MVLQKFKSLKDILRQHRITNVDQQLENFILKPEKEVSEYFDINSEEDLDYFFNDYFIY